MYLDEQGQKWYKGNLHTHSRRTDGKKEPEEIYELYRANGYDFLALTDHWKPSVSEQLDNGLLLLGGCEYNTIDDPVTGHFHIVGIGENVPELDKASYNHDAQKIIDAINADGNIAILAHPAWSLNTESHIRALHGLSGIEIYNTTSGLPWNCRPYSGEVIDQLALRKVIIPCVASDDVHHFTGDECRSYIMVRAEECTPNALLTAIRKGDFYATQGPCFLYEVKGNILKIRTTPVSRIVFYDNMLWNSRRSVAAETAEGLTEYEYEIQPAQQFIRLELIDGEGKMAWSTPFYVNQN